MIRLSIGALGLVLALGGCAAPRYVYGPVWTESAELVTSSASVYPVPDGGRPGEARVMTRGIVVLDDGAPAVHVRLVLVNRSPETWRVDGASQRLEIASSGGHRTLTPEPSAPVVVAAGDTSVVDLFFALPPEARDARDLTEFTAVWTVNAGGRIVTNRTTFERFLAMVPERPEPPGLPPNDHWTPRRP
jgi:hypothetical protein